MRPLRRALWLLLFPALALCLHAQDASTSALRGTVSDASGARVAGAQVVVSRRLTAAEWKTVSDDQGGFAVQMLPPCVYEVRVSAPGMATAVRQGVRLEIGATVELGFTLQVATAEETVTVSGETPLVDTQASDVSAVLESRAIAELPVNGRRFTDLVLLTPGVTQDPRGLSSSANGDLAFGGVRGYHSQHLVDGVDNNNAFFAQARGRYRAPYQFSNEVVQEFRVSSNTYGVEQGRSGGAVVNVVTKSGGNQVHGSLFYFLRDGKLGATPRFLDSKPPDQQHQFGFSLGGPIKRNRAFFFLGFDQHVFRVPLVVQFLTGGTTVTPTPEDYEASDQALVEAAAAELSRMGGSFPARMVGNAAFFKLDYTISPRHFLSARLNTSRYWGENNVFLDPASPITPDAVSENGEERVSTETVAVSLTSALNMRLNSHLRVLVARDLQESEANSAEVRTRIYDVIDGFGRSSILPRQTREWRVQAAETLSLQGKRHSWKFGGDVTFTSIYNYFPRMFGGQYVFDDIRVNPWTFVPWVYGMEITPLRAYAHEVPRYYIQDFGEAESRPDTREFALFAQDTIRLGNHLAVTLGVRYDRQTFRRDRLEPNPLWPGSGEVPSDSNNLAPRVGFALSLGNSRPIVVRGGFGVFYTRLPQMYNSAAETDNGLRQAHLFLDNTDQNDRLLFPTYPAPLVECPPGAVSCAPPAAVLGRLVTEVSAFARDFQVPYVYQGSVGVERELAHRLAVSANYLYVRGNHLIRALDANLPEPEEVSYPVFDAEGNFADEFYTLASFGTWQMTPSLTCPFPPCLNDAVRPVPELDAVSVFESAARSTYHGLTLSARRRMTGGLYFRVAYTWARASDDGQDALVVGRPALVQNARAPWQEWSRSVTDQRHRFVASWVYEPRPFHRDQPLLRALFNDWRIAGVVTVGSGRPVNARVVGDANRDGNSLNDRLPGWGRNAFTGPQYATTDLRLARKIHLSERWRLEVMVESFNVFNRSNKRVELSDDGQYGAAADFVPVDVLVGTSHYPAYYRRSAQFPQPNEAYAPRQVQVALKVLF